MEHAYWNDWYSGWGWFLWLGFIFLLFSGIGNWCYTYQAHRRFAGVPRSDAFDIFGVRYAKGEIIRDEYARIKSEISTTGSTTALVSDKVDLPQGFKRSSADAYFSRIPCSH